MKKKDYAGAQEPLQAALDLRARYLPTGHELIGVSQQALGECSLALQNYPTTIVLLEGAYESLLKYPDKYKENLNTILQNLTEACEKNNLPDKATHYQTLIANL